VFSGGGGNGNGDQIGLRGRKFNFIWTWGDGRKGVGDSQAYYVGWKFEGGVKSLRGAGGKAAEGNCDKGRLKLSRWLMGRRLPQRSDGESHG